MDTLSVLISVSVSLITCCYIMVKLGLAKTLLSKFLAWDTDRLASKKGKIKEITEMKTKLFSSMEKVIKEVGGSVLEVGAGSGPNLEFYPKGTNLITIDLNDNFKPYLESNLAKNEHVKLVNSLYGNVENMKDLVASNSCSCVVSSLLLCCVDQEKTLNEVMRVLKPGGHFYFIEHVIEKQGTWMRWIQQSMNSTWASIRANCNVICNTDEVIKDFGFDDLKASIIYRPIPFLYSFASRSYVGYAVKPSS